MSHGANHFNVGDQADAAGPSAAIANPINCWWQRKDLGFQDDRLYLGQCDLTDLAKKVGTPSYVIRAPRVVEKLSQLHNALDQVKLEHQIFYAIKANRSPKLLTYLAAQRLCGADVCSPGELLHAFSCGFSEENISFTGTSLSSDDLSLLVKFNRLRINLDSLSALERLGQMCPGREVGIRINPDIGIGYTGNELLQYSGIEATKFGIYLDRLPEALTIAKKYNLRIKRIHFHAGCGYLDRELNQLSQVLAASKAFVSELPELCEVNIGGGLGVPHRETDHRLDLNRWAEIVAEAYSGSGLNVAVEPGDFLIKDAGILLAGVTYLERRKNVDFLGLNAGFNLAMEPAFYGLPCEPVPTQLRTHAMKEFTIVGNVNEALDKWAVDQSLPTPEEGDTIALINAGGYAASMRSDHCLRGEVKEIVLLD